MSGNNQKLTPQASASQPAAEPTDSNGAAAARMVAIPKDAASTAVNAPAPVKTEKVKTEPAKTQRIGDILRKVRTDKNEDLYLIAEYLCIKPNFLIALENSHYDELPADAYVIGFLRTYANFLGIDGKEAVDRYRYEMAGRRRKPVLSMPTPVPEGRAPTGIIMVAATLVLLLIYALWYGLSSSNRAEVTKPAPLPSVTQPVPVTDATSSSSAAAGLTAPIANAQATNTQPVIPTPTAQTTTITGQNAASVATPITASTPAGIALGAPPAPQTLAANNAAGGAAGAAAAAVKDTAKTDGDKDADSTDGKNTSGKKATGNTRISIRASQSSWVMITDSNGKAIFDKVLKPGESYDVPNSPGLSLTTGNGSGIALTLDGTELPKVANGAPHVIRDIPLDPDHLSSGLSGTH